MSVRALPITTGEANLLIRERMRILDAKLRAFKAAPEVVLGIALCGPQAGRPVVLHGELTASQTVDLLRTFADELELRAGLKPRQIEQPGVNPNPEKENDPCNPG